MKAETAALGAEPTADLSLVSSSKGGSEAGPEPERAAGPRRRAGERGPWRATMCSLLVIMGVVCLSDRCDGEAPEVVRAEAADGGTVVGLGDTVLMASEGPPIQFAERLVPGASMPRQPFPNQIRPNANGQCPSKKHFAINGGCWFIVGNAKAPCEDVDIYEWEGACYYPVYGNPRQPASEEPP